MPKQEGFATALAALAVEEGDGRWERRLDSKLPLYATVSNPSGNVGFELRSSEPIDVDPSELKSSEQFAMRVLASQPGTLVLETKSREAVDIFVRIADDLLSLAQAKGDEVSAGRAVIRRFNTWQRFLRETSAGLLSEQRRIGLVGELVTLRDLFVPAVGASQAVEAWTGPDRAPQDFQLTQMAVEVKAIVHSEPQTLRIDGERQLDDFGLDVLAIAHHRVFVHKGSGQTLPELVAELRGALASSSTAIETLDDKLITYGYVEDERTLPAYSARGYSVKETSYYRVRGGGFPRITEADLRPGMGQVDYSLSAAVCEPFAVSQEQLIGWLAVPESTVDPETTPESQQVEYKQTAWAPTSPVPERLTATQVSKELQNSVVKSVVAFMNSDGGELVIGVRDSDRAITGIETDLEFRKRDRADTDRYELDIMQLLANHIDQLVHRQVRVSFSAGSGGTACHLAVTPSPTPRFGKPHNKDGQTSGPVFWVRSGNATVFLEGRAMVDYIAEQWY